MPSWGAYGEDGSNDDVSSSGAAYIFERDDSTGDWTETSTILRATYPSNSDYFGRSVAISGTYVVVGAYWEDTGGTNTGAAYIFERNASTGDWDPVDTILKASDAAAFDRFGLSVAISGDYVIVGAYYDDESVGYHQFRCRIHFREGRDRDVGSIG